MRDLLLVGVPNVGKSTMFSALTGQVAETGNVAGTTVAAQVGEVVLGGEPWRVTDLPGSVSLAAHSPDEAVTVRELLRVVRSGRDPVVLFVADANRLSRSLYLLEQILELDVRCLVALNLVDEAEAAGLELHIERLASDLGVAVLPCVARQRVGLDALREAIPAVQGAAAPLGVSWSQEVERAVDEVAARLDESSAVRAQGLARWALLSEPEAVAHVGLPPVEGDASLDGQIVAARYRWIDARLPQWVGGQSLLETSDRLDRVLLHPVSGGLIFAAVMWAVFWSLFAWADPAIGAIEGLVGGLGDAVAAGFVALGLTHGVWPLLSSLLVDGVIAGVGAVVVFIPQIALLFLFLSILEDCGYLARAAHIMDRLLRAAGLPGRAFIPLLSGFACAVPAIMATRTMPRARDRLLTMMVLPLTSCSARLPVYLLLVSALFPVLLPGTSIPLRPLALMGMYLVSTLLSLVAALVLGRLVLPARATMMVLELPPFRVPDVRVVLGAVWRRTTEFLHEAGRVILVATVVLWGMLTFPQYEPEVVVPPEIYATLQPGTDTYEDTVAQYALRESYAGRAGRLLEPAIEPLGYDWKIGIGLLGAFAAREVFVSTLGVVYGIADADEASEGLTQAILADRRPDGTPVFTPAVGLSIMAFFAIAMQCLSTIAVLYKETGGWRWPAFITGYLTVTAWVAAFVVFQVATAVGL